MPSEYMEIRSKIEARVEERASQDPPFRELLAKDPREALAQLLGGPLPGSVKVQVIEAPADTLVLVVPPAPLLEGELSQRQLDAVAGGFGSLSDAISAVGKALQTAARGG